MKTRIEVSGCFPVLRALNAQQFTNAIEPRLLDIRNPLTGLQIDMFGKVTAVDIAEERGLVTVEIEVADDFLQRYQLQPQQIETILVERITKLRHPATGAMVRVEARLAAIKADATR
ncbi:hypothetical protein HEAR1629 [Herminiimonas arsenicoxydans]|uniref:Uncharacterized protein n=1 Tax=Herminiimonas arsenicoxydans TaxID=204773 RepID=A4G5K1_HERAR|nr:hypothetical protein HEAR1629 [Herminiimonas arsenicoxydans]